MHACTHVWKSAFFVSSANPRRPSVWRHGVNCRSASVRGAVCYSACASEHTEVNPLVLPQRALHKGKVETWLNAYTFSYAHERRMYVLWPCGLNILAFLCIYYLDIRCTRTLTDWTIDCLFNGCASKCSTNCSLQTCRIKTPDLNFRKLSTIKVQIILCQTRSIIVLAFRVGCCKTCCKWCLILRQK